MIRKTTFLFILVAVSAASLVLYLSPSEAKNESLLGSEKPFAKAAQGKALFEEKCKTSAGEKIYRRVENVEGILLLKVRPQAGQKEWTDPMWPGAAFANEFRSIEYIKSFLWYEHSGNGKEISEGNRGFLNSTKSDFPGYQFVDVLDDLDGRRYRYVGAIREHEVTSSILIGGDGSKRRASEWLLEKQQAKDPAPQFAITFEDHVIPEERLFGLASSTVRVVDMKTNGVLGEMTRYAWSPSGPSHSNPNPWLSALRCPRNAWKFAQTRQFVDQVLIPIKAK